MASTATNAPSPSPSPSPSSYSSSSPPSSSASSSGPASVSVGDDLLSAGKDARRTGGAEEEATTGSGSSQGSEALDRWVERLHAGIDRLAEIAAPRLVRLQGGMNATRGTLRRQARLVREDGEEWAESLRCTVREHPVTAVAVAAAFGLLLARLSR
ncbi:MAG TPA: hypothetical protein VK195_02730 [Burkholderiaceae bacterium]|nr:hypothetical protein [Burkholderiaceae bacterium]